MRAVLSMTGHLPEWFSVHLLRSGLTSNQSIGDLEYSQITKSSELWTLINSFSYDSFIYVKEGLSKTLIREDDETPCLLSNLESEQKKKKKD